MKILILANDSKAIYNFKNELFIELVKPNSYINNNGLSKNDVTICVPKDINNKKFEEIGCKVIEVDVDRRGTNIIKDLKLFNNYLNIIKTINPDLTLTFTIKPNVYGGIACRITKTNYIAGVTGLGTSIRSHNLLSNFIGKLYKIGTKNASYINFENQSDLDYFNNKIFRNNKSHLLPGSGVNLEKFKYKNYPEDDGITRFLTIGRIMRDKGTYELLEAAKIIKERHDNVEFNFIGLFEEDDLKEKFLSYNEQGIINYLGFRDNVSEIIKDNHCIIHPSYHEGLSNALLEAAASGRPVIASNIPGCKEAFIDGVSGLAVKVKDSDDLTKKIEEFINFSHDKKEQMGKANRAHVEKKFDRKIVVEKQIESIEEYAD